MEEKEMDLLDKMQYLKETVLAELKEELISEEIENTLYNKRDYSSVDMEEIYTNVDEMMKNIKIDLKVLGNTEKQGEGFFEVIINLDESISYEYYDSELEKVAVKKGLEEIELTEKYRDKPKN